MSQLTSAEIRRRFLDFFAERQHRVQPSSGLVPGNDPTLLFTNAGMVQFKDVFTGTEVRDYKRAATSQKCVRAGGKHNDLENVGQTARHHTFFEMLGNFSFGDYFKVEAIKFAWDLLTEGYGLPKDKLWPTVFETDDEAFAIWRDEIGVEENRILRFDEKENFWAMGDTGPCGPCSEILFDRGPEAATMPLDTPPGVDGERYMEIWNLVFMQYRRDASGEMTPLPSPSIDTGMGLERLTSVLQNVSSNYDTDLLRPLVERAAELAGKKYSGGQTEDETSMRVIADHARATTFLVADGVLPSNEGRGYVLRRIMRRAIRHGERLGIQQAFFRTVCEQVIEMMGGHYTELKDSAELITGVAAEEEGRFRETLSQGLKLINVGIAELEEKGEKTIPGTTAFKLYDTYGFPPDLTEVIARERGMSVDMDGYEAAMTEQRQRGGFKGAGDKALAELYQKLAAEHGGTSFTGYFEPESEATLLAILKDGALVQAAGEGDTVELVFDRSPFYAEGGGQVGDRGRAQGPSGEFEIADTQKPAGELFVHQGKVVKGELKVGETVGLTIDGVRRERIRRNHSATHLLHSALRDVLGGHVKQAGSYVDDGRMRFDFSHFSGVEPAQLEEIEGLVNEWVRANYEVDHKEVSIEEARDAGALMFFGDKYGDRVKMISMGPPSLELCGGTHVKSTGDIGTIKLLGDQGIAAGVRRVEGTAGASAIEHVQALDAQLRAAAGTLKGVGILEVADRVGKMKEREKELLKEIETLKKKLATGQASGLMDKVETIGGVKVLAVELEGQDPKGLRDQADKLRDKIGSGVICIGVRAGAKAMVLVAVTKDLTGRFHAGKLVKEVAGVLGGGGGGRPDMAQAGGSKPSEMPAALEKFRALVTEATSS